MTCTVPCKTCPWRKTSTVGGADIPLFDADLMRALRNTVGRGDDFRPIMACHYAEPDNEHACVGYVFVEGYSNLAIRVMVMEDRIPFGQIMDDCEGLDLWPSFAEMLAAYEKEWTS